MDAAPRRGPRQLDDPYPDVLERALRAVVAGDLEGGRTVLEETHFEPPARHDAKRWPSTATIARIYARDRYQCRYCGERTILTPVMRLLSRLYPDQFPMHANWKSDSTHPAFIARSTTLDHLVPAQVEATPSQRQTWSPRAGAATVARAP
ncbi:hypothetical protein [Cellulomonas sp. PhB150]|uniref:hypothetical protein n=1 Tax=Cellulomonas sp. PhB150 TaxID=2485188 RepID=UPI0011CD5337|nr:hypothetical protein [Cellulomonas sp. PhB150]